MKEQHEQLKNEIDDLKKELESFQLEKEQVRAIIGKLGGIRSFRTRLINAVFIIVIVVSVVVSVVCGDKWRLLMIELATVALSVKIIYLIHYQMRINHFKFWILSSIELRVNEIMKQVRELKNQDT